MLPAHVAPARLPRRQSKLNQALSELQEMTLISKREEGLLNHAQAATILEVSTRRIGELVELRKLQRFDFLGRTYVSVKEVLNRRESDLKAGRPRRTLGKKLKAAAKIASHYDLPNMVVDGITPVPKGKRK
jgi:hypothetical protein